MKRKKWLRQMLGELIQIAGQNADTMRKQHEMFKTMISLVNQAVVTATKPDWLVITEDTKINIHEISSIEHEQKGDEGSWRIRMHNDVEFTVPEKQLLADAARSNVFSFLPYRNFSTD